MYRPKTFIGLGLRALPVGRKCGVAGVDHCSIDHRIAPANTDLLCIFCSTPIRELSVSHPSSSRMKGTECENPDIGGSSFDPD